MTNSTHLVVFDLFGTLVNFGISHHPYRKILKWAFDNGRKPRDTDARVLMTRNEPPETTLRSMGIEVPIEMLDSFHREIHEELTSLSLYDDVMPTLSALAKSEIDFAICSNLAQPYGVIVEQLLSGIPCSTYLSYELGFIKPDNKIYDAIVEKSGFRKSEILFVGDTFIADYDGPTKYGFRAFHLCRNHIPVDIRIQSLLDVLNRI